MKNEPSHNEMPADDRLDARLSKALASLPDAPVASNFTMRVMLAMDVEESQQTRNRPFRWNWHVLLPRMAVAIAVMTFIAVGVQYYTQNLHRTEVAQSIAFVTGNHPLPSVETLKNFDAIQRMGQSQHADEELLALLQ